MGVAVENKSVSLLSSNIIASLAIKTHMMLKINRTIWPLSKHDLVPARPIGLCCWKQPRVSSDNNYWYFWNELQISTLWKRGAWNTFRQRMIFCANLHTWKACALLLLDRVVALEFERPKNMWLHHAHLEYQILKFDSKRWTRPVCNSTK